MKPVNQFVEGAMPGSEVSCAAQLTLYDRYGAMAYGVITQIVSRPDVAQAVLIDLFASAQPLPDSPSQAACAIVRMARLKALEAKHAEPATSLVSESHSSPNDNVPKLIFNLSFTKGLSLKTVAEQLGMSYSDVLKALRTYVKSVRIY